MSVIKRQIEKLQARALYEKLRVKTGASEKRLVLICPHSIGDTYFTCALAYAVAAKVGAREIGVVVRPFQAGIVRMFPSITHVFVEPELPPSLLHFFPRFYEDIFLKQAGLWVGHINYYPSGDISPALGYSGLHFVDLYKMFFWLPKETALEKPQVSRTNIKAAKQRFAQYGLKPKKTVILAPETTTTANLNRPELWHELAKKLEARGFEVATLVTQEETKGFGYPNPITFPLSQAIPFIEEAGWMIASRSGICDLASTAKAKLTVLYPDSRWYQGSVFEVASLRRMGLSKTMQEIEIANSDTTSLALKKIFNRNGSTPSSVQKP